jgi:hypothetical protein
MSYLIISSCILFFALAHLFSALSLFARIAGKLSSKPYLSQSLEKILQLLSMVCIALFAPLLAFVTESVYSTEHYLLMVALSQTFSAILLVYAYRYRVKILIWMHSGMSAFEHKSHILMELYRSLKTQTTSKIIIDENAVSRKCKYFVSGLGSNIFLASGFFVGFYLASLYPDQRLTLAQLAVFIHGLGAVIQSLYADPALGRSLDNSERTFWWSAFFSYYWGRLSAYFVLAIIFFVLFLLKNY